MPSVRRWARHIFTSVSLLLLVVTSLAWALSPHNPRRFILITNIGGSTRGDVIFVRHAVFLDRQRVPGVHIVLLTEHLGFAGFHYAEQGDRYRMVAIPYWFLLAATGVIPLLRLFGIIRRQRRTRAGRGPACGYNLRATPNGCQECGHVPTRVPHCPPPRRA
jgi:hypothetical protein